MKVQLERKLPPCPDQMGCVVCQQRFTVPNIRALVCNDAGLIQGDICPKCLKLPEKGIRQKIKAQSGQLLQQATRHPERALPLRQQALELLSLSQETLTLPKFYQWFFKRWEILAEENRELEAARLGLHGSCTCGRRSRLRIVFEDD